VVFACRQLHHLNPEMSIHAELADCANVLHLDSLGLLVQSGPLASYSVPSFISGMALLPRLIDCMLVQVREGGQMVQPWPRTQQQ
jgi:hypothetical protein